MNKKCNGCGVILQTTNSEELGYIKEQNLGKSTLCERCFRIRNYGDYKTVTKDNSEYLKILEGISKSNDLVVLVVDVFNIGESLNDISKIISNPILLVLSKRDILPRDIYEQKILDYMNKFSLNIFDKLLISTNKNYNLDELLSMINKYKHSDRVYIIGQSNAGKSTLINKMLYNYSNNKTIITTSFLPSTTLDTIEIKLSDDLTLIDTPGLLDEGNIVNLVDGNSLKKIIPSKEIKPITYQAKTKQYILLDKYAYLELEEPTNLTLFVSDKLKIDRLFTYRGNKKLIKHTLSVKDNQDIVIKGLCFIKISKPAKINVYTLDGVSVYLRDTFI